MCESAALSFLIGAASGAISSSSGRRSRTRLAFSRRTSSFVEDGAAGLRAIGASHAGSSSRASSRDSRAGIGAGGDRKSTRLNSSHGYISYAVFCLKKKKKRCHRNSVQTHVRQLPRL